MIIDNNFSFDGRHCLSDMGLIYVPAPTRNLIAPRRVVSYAVGGVSGRVAYGDDSVADEYQTTGVLYAAGDLRSETEARALWRRVAAWLTVGRRQLIWDSEPDRYIIAEAVQLTMSEYGWLDGGLQVTWLCQPYSWERHLQIAAQAELTTDYPAMVAQLHVETGRPAPVTVQVDVTGTAALTALEIVVGGKRVSLAGMELVGGVELEITMEHPIGATVTWLDGRQSSALPHMEQMEELQIPSDGAETSATATFAGDGGAAVVRIAARGCWE